MGRRGKLQICLCSECGELTHEVDGVEVRGVLLDKRAFNRHQNNEELRGAVEAELLASLLGSSDDRGKEPSLPSRRRDDILPGEGQSVSNLVMLNAQPGFSLVFIFLSGNCWTMRRHQHCKFHSRARQC